jgi:hypothetical protein
VTLDDAPAAAEDDGGVLDRVVADQLAPFVAWLATRSLDETARRRIRIVVEGFLVWSRTDPGPVGGRRRRYEEHLRGRRPADLPTVREGLDRWAEHRVLVARTLPIDGR